QGKRRYSLNRIMTKLSGTSETAIMLSFLVMNLNWKDLKTVCMVERERLPWRFRLARDFAMG
ncbi:MAG: hypothetical protein CR984_03535, partial [Proteobacteria bacterium]